MLLNYDRESQEPHPLVLSARYVIHHKSSALEVPPTFGLSKCVQRGHASRVWHWATLQSLVLDPYIVEFR